MLLEWTKEMSVGVKEIDEQHKKLFSLLNELFDAISTNKLGTIIGDTLDEAIDYTKYHFSTEEKYFEKFDYKDKASHKKKHAYFKSKVERLKKEYSEKIDMDGMSDTGIELMNFLKDWWIEHIMHIDKKYTTCFHEHGLY